MGSFSEADPGLESRDLMSADELLGLTCARLLAALTLVAVNNFFPIQV